MKTKDALSAQKNTIGRLTKTLMPLRAKNGELKDGIQELVQITKSSNSRKIPK